MDWSAVQGEETTGVRIWPKPEALCFLCLPFIVSFNFSLSSFPLFTTFFSSVSLFHSRFKKIFPPPISPSFLSPLAPEFLYQYITYLPMIYLSIIQLSIFIYLSINYLPINNHQLSLTSQSSAIYNPSIIYQSPVIHQSCIYHLLINIYQLLPTNLLSTNYLSKIIYLSSTYQLSTNHLSTINHLSPVFCLNIISLSAHSQSLSLWLLVLISAPSLPPFLLDTCPA